ncbi:hypothetical protein ACHAXR_009765, partial [Thalassiosira sp. AJA248-18]
NNVAFVIGAHAFGPTPIAHHPCSFRSRLMGNAGSSRDKRIILHQPSCSIISSRHIGNNKFEYRTNSVLYFSRSQNEEEEDDVNVDHDDDSSNNQDYVVVDQEEDHHNWTSQTLAIALPALAGMMTDPLLSLVDTLYVGRLGYNAARVGSTTATTSSIPLAALGACTSIFHLSFHCFRATTLSTSSLIAGALVRDEQQQEQNESSGEKHNVIDSPDNNSSASSIGHRKEAVLIAQTSVQQAIITGVLITAFLLAFGPRCLFAMGVSQGGPLYESALTYLNHRSIAAPAVIMLSACEGIFRGSGDVITPWKVSCVVAILNLILDPFCMFGGGGGGGKRGLWMGLGMGIKGAAVATAFSQVCGALLYGRWLFQKGLLGGGSSGGNNGIGNTTMTTRERIWAKLRVCSPRQSLENSQQRAALKRQKRSVAATILRANAAMMAKQGSLLLGWAYATSRATRLGHTVVASHQMALSIWLVVALVLEGAGVAAQVLMAREWEGLKVLEKKEVVSSNSEDVKTQAQDSAALVPLDKQRRTIKSLSLYMITLSIIQGLVGSLAVLLLRQTAPSFILTHDPIVRQNLLTLLPHIAAQMALVSVTLVAEALAIGGGRFKWLAGGTTVSSVIAIVKLRGAVDLVGVWKGGIVALFLGRLATALLAVMDMNGCFRWRSVDVKHERKSLIATPG